MPITEILEQNAKLYGGETALVEINPEVREDRRVTWKEYELIERGTSEEFRREITWSVFNEKANRCANLLMSRGIKKGDKVAILLMNCLEWLPVYFGILKTGALAVPMNYRYSADEIRYCADLADVDALFFGPEFIGRVEEIIDRIPRVKLLFYVGDNCPTFAENFLHLASNQPSNSPDVALTDADDAAIYFSSGTTGFPKAILHNHESLMHAARTEQKHHSQTHEDVFLCIPPLYHTGAKMHWFGSFLVGGRAVLLKGVKPLTIIKTAAEEHCSIVWLLVPWAQDILDAIDRGEIDLAQYDLSHWRLMHIGAQPVPRSLIKRWKEKFPNHQYDTNYGLSESIGPGCVHLGVENIEKVGAIGVPGYGWQARIIDEQGGPQGHRRGAPRRLAVDRRHGHAGRGRLHLSGGPQEGRHHHRRRKPVSRPDRGLPAGPSRHQGRGGHRHSPRAPGRDRRGDHRAEARRDGHRGGHRGLLPGHAPLQAAPEDHLRRRAPQPHRQDRKAEVAPDLRRAVPGRRAGWPLIGQYSLPL